MASSDETAGGDGPSERRGVPLVPLAVLVLVAVLGFSAAYFSTGGDDAAPAAGDVAETTDDPDAGDDGAEPESDYDVDVQPDPDPPKVEGTTFVVTVTEDGEPVTDARVRIAMEMDRHAHEGVDGQGDETEPGRYEVPVTFVMRGQWSGNVSVIAGEAPEVRESVSYQVE